MHQKHWKVAAGTALSAGLLAAPLTAVPAIAADDPSAPPGTSAVVINEAYLSGGSSGSAFRIKFVELYNSSDTPVSLAGWSLQYRSATSTGAPTGITPLTGSIPAKGYYLIQGATNSGTSTAPALPAPDVQATGTLNPGGTAGTLVLAKQSNAVSPLAAGAGTDKPAVADLLGYGTSNTFETSAATAPTGNTDVKSLNRSNGVDTNSNAADFSLSATITPTASGGGNPPTEPEPAPGLKTIAEIQGTSAASPLVGSTVTTRGKVTAVYATGGFNGYYVQTPGSGGEAAGAVRTASDALFIYSPTTAGTVQSGDYVELTGVVSEFANQTQLTVEAAGLQKLSEPAPEVKPTPFDMPPNARAREALEGMLVAPQGPYTVTDNYSLNQYGEIGLAAGTSPLVQPTAVATYGSPEYAAVVADNALRGIKLDD